VKHFEDCVCDSDEWFVAIGFAGSLTAEYDESASENIEGPHDVL
jgi:hypothetical protein